MMGEPEDFVLDADVLVLGGGPAGAWAATTAAQRGASVVLADKGRVGTSGATAAANTAVIDVAPGSAARRQVIGRRLERGLGLAQAEWIERMVDEAHARLGQLAEWGYAFARDDRGAVYRGSLRGPDYMQLLRRRLHKAGVRILDHSPAFKLLLRHGEVVGAEGLTRAGAPWAVQSGAVVAATGGCAFMSRALGTYGLTGDGLLMAAEAGAALSGMEFSGQYGISHVAATVTKNLIYDWATFSDETGHELDGGDVFEIVARNLPLGPVYAIIDKASPAIQEGLRRGQPNIFLPLDRLGIDPFRQHFPVTLRYEGTVRGVGGVAVDRNCAASVPGLFAAGDAASREFVVGAVSGGGGPNSTWAIASGVWAGEAASNYAARNRARGGARPAARADCANQQANGDPGADACAAAIKAVQSELFPLERNFSRDEMTMRGSLSRLDSAWQAFETAGTSSHKGESPHKARETAAMLASARWIYASALERRETRGIHRRRDHPAPDSAPPARLQVRGVARIVVERA
jgi:succinate dehydrogenase/fumarate reductase flavoprotein subunit